MLAILKTRYLEREPFMYEVVRACAIAIQRGTVLQAGQVSAGRGMVIDWREVKCGETMLDGADAIDVAYLFVTLVGPEVARSVLEGNHEEPAVDLSQPRILFRWVVQAADAAGRPTLRTAVLDRIRFPGLAVFHERGRYVIASEVSWRSGTYEPTGFAFGSQRELTAHLMQIATIGRGS
jgi:hypothetical protein